MLRLRKAIEREQLRLDYQPKADMRTGAIVGAEALVRWHAPRRGLIRPDEFIPKAERIPGTIKLLTEWVLNAALRQVRTWQLEGHEIPVAVNLSPRSVHDGSLPDTIGQMLSKWQVPPRMLQLELTETAVFGMAESEQVPEIMRELSEMGLLIALDDFGTGYSSLSRLRELPIGQVKIDKSFVMSMEASHNDFVIVRSVVALARNLGMRAVAEGVETEAAWQTLAELGCDVAQGNYLSIPMPAERVLPWVRQWEELYEEAHRLAAELIERREGVPDRRSGIDDRRLGGANGKRRFERASI